MDDVVEEVIAIDGRDLRLLRPRDAEALLDEHAFEHEEYLPYWAELWPSALALARAVAGRVLATDWSSEAIAMTAANAERNGATLETLVCSWTAPDPLLARAPYDLILASDVLYEARNADTLLDLLPKLGSDVWLADPGRKPAARFLTEAAATWDITERRVPELRSGALYRLRRQ